MLLIELYLRHCDGLLWLEMLTMMDETMPPPESFWMFVSICCWWLCHGTGLWWWFWNVRAGTCWDCQSQQPTEGPGPEPSQSKYFIWNVNTLGGEGEVERNMANLGFWFNHYLSLKSWFLFLENFCVFPQIFKTFHDFIFSQRAEVIS